MKIKFNRFQPFYEGNDIESDQARENQVHRVGCATTRWELLGEKWTENDCLPISYTAEERRNGDRPHRRRRSALAARILYFAQSDCPVALGLVQELVY